MYIRSVWREAWPANLLRHTLPGALSSAELGPRRCVRPRSCAMSCVLSCSTTIECACRRAGPTAPGRFRSVRRQRFTISNVALLGPCLCAIMYLPIDTLFGMRAGTRPFTLGTPLRPPALSRIKSTFVRSVLLANGGETLSVCRRGLTSRAAQTGRRKFWDRKKPC